jgi:hypothetical protein
MKAVLRPSMISVVLIIEFLLFFYSTTFLMSYFYELDSAPIAF